MAIKEATINVSLMEYVVEEEGVVLKPVRGSLLPLKTKTNARYDEILETALKSLRSQVLSDCAQKICSCIDLSLPEIIASETEMDNSAVQNEDMLSTLLLMNVFACTSLTVWK